MSKNKWIAAIMNFFLLGPGYIYNGKRIVFGIGLTIAAILATFVELQLQDEAPDLFPVSFASFFILGSMCAYDGFKEAEKMSE